MNKFAQKVQKSRLRYRGPIVGAVILALGALSLTSISGAQAADRSYSLLSHSDIQAAHVDSDTNSVELGVSFTSSESGSLTKVKFLKARGDVDTHAVSVWDASGKLLATKTSSDETKSGWQRVALDAPVAIQSGKTYVVSYHTSRYVATNNFFTKTLTSGPLTAAAGNNGVYAYSNSSTFPTHSFKSSNYWVDLAFVPSAGSAPSTSTTVTSTTIPKPTTTTSSTTIPKPTTTTTVKPTTTTTSVVVSPPSGSSSGSVGGSFPDASNTGYQHAPGYTGTLTDCSGQTIQSNTTYKFCKFTNGLEIGNSNGTAPQNVTFIGCLFESNFNGAGGGAEAIVKYSNGNNIVFDYDTFQPNDVTSAPVSYQQGVQYAINQVENGSSYAAGSFSVDHSNMWGLAEAIELGASSQSKPVTISNSWIHDARADGGIDHTDGILVNGGDGVTYLTINHNTIVSAGNTNGIGLQGTSGYDHVAVTNNYVSGWGYTVAFDNGTTNNSNDTFMGNVFGTEIQPVYGPLYISYGGDDNWHTTANNLWRNNTINVAAGGFVGNTAADGKYWLPQWTDTGYPTPSNTDWTK